MVELHRVLRPELDFHFCYRIAKAAFLWNDSDASERYIAVPAAGMGLCCLRIKRPSRDHLTTHPHLALRLMLAVLPLLDAVLKPRVTFIHIKIRRIMQTDGTLLLSSSFNNEAFLPSAFRGEVTFRVTNWEGSNHRLLSKDNITVISERDWGKPRNDSVREAIFISSAKAMYVHTAVSLISNRFIYKTISVGRHCRG
jgi:hypothetical protein